MEVECHYNQIQHFNPAACTPGSMYMESAFHRPRLQGYFVSMKIQEIVTIKTFHMTWHCVVGPDGTRKIKAEPKALTEASKGQVPKWIEDVVLTEFPYTGDPATDFYPGTVDAEEARLSLITTIRCRAIPLIRARIKYIAYHPSDFFDTATGKTETVKNAKLLMSLTREFFGTPN